MSYKNLAFGLVSTIPSPPTSGTSLVLQSGQGTRFPDPATESAFYCTVCPPNVDPDPSNSEIIKVTGKSTDTLTIVRAQRGSSARTIAVGDRIFLGVYKEDVGDEWIDLTDGATIDVDMLLGRKFRVKMLAGNRTLTFTNPVIGKAILLELGQDGVGTRLITWPTGDSTFALADVNITTDEITVGRDIPQCTPIKFSSTGGVPAGLVAGTLYYAIRVSATVIKVASTLALAQAGTAIDITGQGTGTHTLQALIRWMNKLDGSEPTLSTGKYMKDSLIIIPVEKMVYEGYIGQQPA